MPTKRKPLPHAPAGRKSLYKEEYNQIVIDLMSKGLSFAAVCTELQIGRDTITHWRNQYPQFGLACELGMAAAQRWWENLALEVANGAYREDDGKKRSAYKNANHGMIMFIMARRFPDYYSKKETVIESDSSSRETVMKTLTPDERLHFISKYQKLISELSQTDLSKNPLSSDA